MDKLRDDHTKNMYCKYAIMILSLLAGCDEARVFEEDIDLEERFWEADSMISFEFAIENVRQPYHLFFNVRNSVAYPYRNLYIHYYLQDSTGKEIRSALINQELFDPKTGQPYGSGLGDIFDHQFLVLQRHRFSYPGLYRMSFQHFMRRDTLPHIFSVGLRVEKAEQDPSQ